MLRLSKAADLIGARKRILLSRTVRSVASDREISCSLPWYAFALVARWYY